MDSLAGDPAAPGWLGSTLFDAYLRFKRAEIAHVRDMSVGELCALYGEIY